MARQMDRPVATGDETPGARAWRERARSWRQRLPNLRRWQLIALAGIGLLFVLWSGTTIGFSKAYYAEMYVVEGGAIGIPPPLERLDFGDVPAGASMERKIRLENDSPIPVRVSVFAWGEIRNLLTFDDAFFTMGPGDDHTIVVEARALASAEPKKYGGRVFVVQTPWPFGW